MSKRDMGIIGLAVMGQNLALNFARHGYAVAAYDRDASNTRRFTNRLGADQDIVACESVQALCESLRAPRKILLMIRAGEPVDQVIDSLLPHLSGGDTIIDGGNSYYADTIRRSRRLEALGIHYLGAGISGGEEGALAGPSIMPGGSPAAWEQTGEMLTAIAARAEGAPCCAYLGGDGVGHYVKVTHNGIEYADMQLICEAYDLMTRAIGLTPYQAGEVFAEWNRGELDSYLIQITADILSRTDPDTGKPMVDIIADQAGQKGTGKWTSQQALDLGIPAPTIVEAVLARYLSSLQPQRLAAARVLSGPPHVPPMEDADNALEDLRVALYAAKIASYAQGFALLREAAKEYNWALDYGTVAMLWRGGCIIRARFLSRIMDAYQRKPDLENLMLDGFFSSALARAQQGWRNTAALAAAHGVPAPAMMSALAYYDGYRAARLPAALLQAQRDYFGAHTYERIDRQGSYHTQWTGE